MYNVLVCDDDKAILDSVEIYLQNEGYRVLKAMDGLQALGQIMNDCPTPVIMFSSLTREGAKATIEALSLGAVDFVSKVGGSISKVDTVEDEILTKARTAVGAKGIIRKAAAAPSPAPLPPMPEPKPEPKSEPKPQPAPQPKPEPKPEPQPAPQPRQARRVPAS